MRLLVRYIADLCKGWIGLISSSASVLFLILGLFRNLTLGFQRRYWLCASFGCYAIASFLAWYKIRPDLGIEIRSITTQEILSSFSDQSERSTLILFEIFLVNKHAANNSRKKETLSVRGTQGKLYADPFFLHGYWVKSEYSDPNDLHARKRIASARCNRRRVPVLCVK